MFVAKIDRKQLSIQLHHKDTSKIRTAISRKYLFEDNDGLININSTENKKWLKDQIILNNEKGNYTGFVFTGDDNTIALEEIFTDPSQKSFHLENELIKAKLDFYQELTKTVQQYRKKNLT